MTKRLLLLSDEEIETVLGWAEVAESVAGAERIPTDVVGRDFAKDDEEIVEKFRSARLSP